MIRKNALIVGLFLIVRTPIVNLFVDFLQNLISL